MAPPSVRNILFALAVVLVGATGFAALAVAQGSPLPNTAQAQDGTGASPWDRQENAVVKQADAWFENYKFRDGESIPRLRIHYATLGTPHRNDQGDIDNAVLVLHWTGADGRALLSPTYMKALFDRGQPLDLTRPSFRLTNTAPLQSKPSPDACWFRPMFIQQFPSGKSRGAA
jgi:homoserine O-acetyltransferase/O-succinyltransferase